MAEVDFVVRPFVCDLYGYLVLTPADPPPGTPIVENVSDIAKRLREIEEEKRKERERAAASDDLVNF